MEQFFLRKIIFLTIFTILLAGQTIKDISSIVGIRDNQLIGYGLIVGLNGTGDKSKFTMQSLQNLLRNSYIKIPTSSIKSKNIAAVMVTATLPPFSRQGDKINIKISAIGDAKSIDNGELLLTQLKGVDGNVYALAQGKIIADRKNKTTGTVYYGATVENEVDFNLNQENEITISLFQNSARNAALIERKINKHFLSPIAKAIDTKTIVVQKPQMLSMVSFIAEIQDIKINSLTDKKVVIDVAKELILAGGDIEISPVLITQENFSIRIKNKNYTNKEWKSPENTGVDIGDNTKIGSKPVRINLNNALLNSKDKTTLSDLIRAMKVMKLSIFDIINTIRLLKQMGAIDAQIEIRD
jgi:flagellar P-ring protein precursor FlgI